MPPFSWQATAPDGRVVSGVMEAPDQAAVVERLRKDDFFPVAIAPESKRRPLASYFPRRAAKLTSRELLDFTRQMAVLLKSGLELDRCLVIMHDLMAADSGRVIVRNIQKDVHAGETLSRALAKQEGSFPPIYLNMVRAGETGGFLEKVFERLSVFLETRMRLIESVRSALIYPAVVVTAGVVAVGVLMVYVIPKFAKIFEGMGGELPFSTRMLIGFSHFIGGYWYWLVAAAIGAAFAFRQWLATPAGRVKWDGVVLRLPLFGALATKTMLAQFTRTFGTLLQSGVPIMQSLMIVKDTVSNKVLARLLEKTAKGVKEGRRISAQLAESGLFPPLATHMILVGEESGQLDEMMLKMAAIYDEEVETAVKRMLALLEPALILAMGIGVAFVVVSMLTAIFSANDLLM